MFLHSYLLIIRLIYTYILAHEYTLPLRSDMLTQRPFRHSQNISSISKAMYTTINFLLVDIISGHINARNMYTFSYKKIHCNICY